MLIKATPLLRPHHYQVKKKKKNPTQTNRKPPNNNRLWSCDIEMPGCFL